MLVKSSHPNQLIHLMVSTGVVYNKLESMAVWEEGLELHFPGLVAGIHAGVVPGLLLLLRLGTKLYKYNSPHTNF